MLFESLGVWRKNVFFVENLLGFFSKDFVVEIFYQSTLSTELCKRFYPLCCFLTTQPLMHQRYTTSTDPIPKPSQPLVQSYTDLYIYVCVNLVLLFGHYFPNWMCKFGASFWTLFFETNIFSLKLLTLYFPYVTLWCDHTMVTRFCLMCVYIYGKGSSTPKFVCSLVPINKGWMYKVKTKNNCLCWHRPLFCVID